MTLPHGMAVRYFHKLMGQPAPQVPILLPPERWKLRDDLITEEMKELERAYYDGDLVAFADACVDLAYVVIGTAVEAGVPFDKVFDEVHRSNMAKAPKCEPCYGFGYTIKDGSSEDCGKCAGRGRVVRFRDDGKVLKPVGWQAPDVAGIMEEASGGSGEGAPDRVREGGG